jgi:hypothetical protein
MATILETVGGANFSAGFAGMIADGEPAQIDSFTLSGATEMDFGILVVRDTADRSCKVMAADTDQQVGISVRHADMVTDASGNVKYRQYMSVPVLRDGVIFVKAAEAVRRGDQVLAITAGGAGNTAAGAFGGSQGGVAGSGRVDVPGAVWEDTTASGAIGRIRIKSAGTRRTTT